MLFPQYGKRFFILTERNQLEEPDYKKHFPIVIEKTLKIVGLSILYLR